ncbi:hypothetical protein [Catenuloplanes indicus]|uniref:Uncharacterized protein n=1 Tax=Catenuloplanes indicus TaxID=137267 RepID=A0AAE3VVL7_9ACTN|nr:hypothetical protein [Catenuloplanes indicus]MDQ0364571.1 hypothetical protein [Catenuloplanes indicus]
MPPTHPSTADTGAAPSVRRHRSIIIIAAIAAVAVLAAGVALAVYLSTPRDSGIAACHRIDQLGMDLAEGARPVLTPDELDEIADDLAGSENDVLSHFGLEYLRWALAGEPERFRGAQGTLHLHTQALPACVVAGVDMATSN